MGGMMTRNRLAGLLASVAMMAVPSMAADASQPAGAKYLAISVAQQVLRCWKPPVAAPDTKGIAVRLDIRLSIEGRLAAMPTPAESLDLSDPNVKAAILAATKAVYACAPYNLPAERYSVWKEIIVAFDPRML